MKSFMVPGTPVAWQRPRCTVRGGKARFFPIKKDVAWRDRVAFAATRAGVPYHPEGPMFLEIVAVWPRPKGWPKTKRLDRQRKATRPDADNVAKAVCDALQGVAYRDDAQADFCVRRYYGAAGEPAHTEIRVLEG